MPRFPVDILLVEDNPNDVELTLRALQQACPQKRVQVARDGVEALDFIYKTGAFAGQPADEYPRVILLDIKLPRVDGFQVLSTLKRDPQTQPIPVVVLTSSSDDRDVSESYRLGANSYIVKPIDYETFLKDARILGTYWLELNQI